MDGWVGMRWKFRGEWKLKIYCIFIYIFLYLEFFMGFFRIKKVFKFIRNYKNKICNNLDLVIFF